MWDDFDGGSIEVNLQGEQIAGSAEGEDKAKGKAELADAGDETAEASPAAEVEREGEEAAAAEPAPEIELPEADDKKFSSKVQKRIQREFRLRKAEEDRRIAAETQRHAAEARAAELERQLTEERAAHQKAKTNQTVTELDGQVLAKRREIISLRDGGDYEKEEEAREELAVLVAKRELIASGQAAAPSPAKAERGEDQSHAARRPPEAGAQPYPKVVQWTQRNPWFGKPEFAAQSQMAQIIDAQIAGEGYNPQTDDYYIELDRRLRAAARLPDPPKPPPSPVAGVGGDAPVRSGNGKVVLTRDDFKIMRDCGMDPADKRHQIAFAREKQKMQAAEQGAA
jgi:hypothetical protein